MRLTKAQALENRFNDSQAHAKRLMKEVDTQKKSKKSSEKGSKALRCELDKVRGKLNNLWASQEADLEHCRLVTKYEADKVSECEIAKLVDHVSVLEEQARR